jgi:hypothetical protein
MQIMKLLKMYNEMKKFQTILLPIGGRTPVYLGGRGVNG